MDFIRRALNTSLASRLLISAAFLSLIVLAGLILILSTVYKNQTLTTLDNEIDRTLFTLLDAVQTDENGQLIYTEGKMPSDPVFDRRLSGRYWAIIELADNGSFEIENSRLSRSLFQSNIPWPEQDVSTLTRLLGEIQRGDGIGPLDEPLRMAAEAITMSNHEAPIILFVAFDRTDTDRGALQFMGVLVAAMSALGAVILIALWFGVRSALKPLSRVRLDIEDIREGRRTQLENNYPSEVLPLSKELNKLLEHNRGVVERAKTHVGNLAHALKTPLAVMMNEASGDTALDDVVRRQTGAMHDSVQHYLKRARAAATAQTLGARSEVKPVLDGLSRMLNKLFDAEGVEVVVACPDHLYFRGEKQSLEEMVGNLMENACKWARSSVHVSVEMTEEGFLLHVDDDGNGLTQDERSDALKRGVRLDEAAPGTGLGLSIVTEIAQMHSGAFILGDAPELGGLRATLRLQSA